MASSTCGVRPGLCHRLKVPCLCYPSARRKLALPQRSELALSVLQQRAYSARVTIQVSQLCFEAALPLFEEEAAAGPRRRDGAEETAECHW